MSLSLLPKVEEKKIKSEEKNPKLEEKSVKLEENPKVEDKKPTKEKNPKVEDKKPTKEKNPKVEDKKPTKEKNPKVEDKKPMKEKHPKIEEKTKVEDIKPMTDKQQKKEKEMKKKEVNQYATRKWKIPKPKDAIIIAVSSRVLFDMEEERKVFDEDGIHVYEKLITDHEDKPLKPGAAFSFVHALENINLKLLEMNPDEQQLFDVVLMSNNSANCGISLINSVNHHRLIIERFCLTAGQSVVGYLSAYGTDLYLSANESNVVAAIEKGIAAAMLFPGADRETVESSHELRIAFDGDAVLFSDESEIIAKSGGLEKFFENEEKKADEILEVGPLKRFAVLLGEIKKKFTDRGIDDCPIRIYLVTARSAASSGLRALRTLRDWGLEIDEMLFLAGAPKGPILQKIKPHLFFDDQEHNISCGLEHGVNAAYVPYGVARKLNKKA